MKKFYVYEHWRTDTNQCFYVGKGVGGRAFEKRKNRNEYYLRIVNKVEKSGHEIKIIVHCDCLDEASAFSMEMERIAFWREKGIELCNLTIGGDGIRGIGEVTLAKMRASSQKRWENLENRKNHSTATKNGMANPDVRKKCGHSLGRTMPKEVGQKISSALKGRLRPQMSERLSGDKNPFYGKRHSLETLAKIAMKRTGHKMSEATKEKMRLSQALRREREAELKNAPTR